VRRLCVSVVTVSLEDVVGYIENVGAEQNMADRVPDWTEPSNLTCHFLKDA